ncbi:hypothetical protein SAMN03159512_00733 [Pseudomonas sp. NFR09]|nr:hypothetical protein SAMN03159512_00733 [Pseudomonas sp. NFR09]SFB14821.1 hypothetical protein SAMN03159485_03149 [Pseudomonas sp. NFPP24]SFO87898.1 hypothetical protein SAMN03159315_00986 [Pseudomonas sp. NFPP28]
MTNPVGQGYAPSFLYPGLSDVEAESKIIKEKIQRDTLDNNWLGAEMKNVNDMLQKAKGQ